MILDDRSRDQLWEKGYVEKYLCIVFLGPGSFPVNIDHIRQRLEGIKGNSNRQCHLGNREISKAARQDFANYLCQEIKVFKIK